MEDEVIDSTVEDVAQQDTPEAPSMDDTIRETLAQIEARGTEEEITDDRPRNEKGQFVAKDASPQVDPSSPPPPEETTEKPLEPVVPAEDAPITVPPELQRLGLRKEEAEAFQKADKVLQDAFLRRSEEMQKGFEQVRQKAQFADQIGPAIAPFMQDIQAVGATPAQAIQSLLSSERALRYGTPEQKIQMLSKIANDYGIDLGQFSEYHANRPMVDPQVTALQAQLQQMQSWITQQNQQREWQERQTLNSEIERFKADPSNTHFDAVSNDMAGLLQAGLASSLKDAYEKAIYANPLIRAKVLAEQQAKADEARKQELAQKAQNAKRAAAVNLPKRGTLPPSRPLGSMDDTIRETLREMNYPGT